MDFKCQRGTALVELAMTAPLLLFVGVAAIGLAQAGQKKAMVARAAAVAARVAVVRPELAPDAARDYIVATDPSVKPGDVVAKVAPVDGLRLPFTQPTRVIVTVKYRPLTGFGWRPTFNLRSEFFVDRWSNGVWFDIQQ